VSLQTEESIETSNANVERKAPNKIVRGAKTKPTERAGEHGEDKLWRRKPPKCTYGKRAQRSECVCPPGGGVRKRSPKVPPGRGCPLKEITQAYWKPKGGHKAQAFQNGCYWH